MSDKNLITRFSGPNAAYYAKTFGVIQARTGLVLTFNAAAAVFGPLWAGMRGLSFLFLLLCFLDLGALSQVTSGLWGNTDGAGLARIAQLEATIGSRRAEATEALANGNAAVAATATKLADNLQKAVDAARAKAALNADGAGLRVIGGIILLLVARLVTGFFANTPRPVS